MRSSRPFLKLVALVLILVVAAVLFYATPAHEYFTRERMVEGLTALRSSFWAPVIFVTL